MEVITWLHYLWFLYEYFLEFLFLQNNQKTEKYVLSSLDFNYLLILEKVRILSRLQEMKYQNGLSYALEYLNIFQVREF